MDDKLRLELAKDDLYILKEMYKDNPTEKLKEDIKNTKKEIKQLENTKTE